MVTLGLGLGIEDGDIFGECDMGFGWGKKGGFSRNVGSSGGLKGSAGFGMGGIGSGSRGGRSGSGTGVVSGAVGMLGLAVNIKSVS